MPIMLKHVNQLHADHTYLCTGWLHVCKISLWNSESATAGEKAKLLDGYFTPAPYTLLELISLNILNLAQHNLLSHFGFILK